MYARHLPKGLDFARGSILSPTRSLNTMALIPKHSITVWGKSKPAGEASSGLSIRVRKRTFDWLKKVTKLELLSKIHIYNAMEILT